MTLIRPELRDRLWRWREAAAGAAAVCLGLYWAAGSLGLMRWIGVAVLLFGGAVVVSGIRRALLPGTGGGPGVVVVDERQITFFGPETGATLSIDSLNRVEFDTRTGRTWLLHASGAPVLRVPADARGAEVLFDALAPLPGLRLDAAIRAARTDAQGLFVIWQRDRLRLH